jgi:hypothetical protein
LAAGAVVAVAATRFAADLAGALPTAADAAGDCWSRRLGSDGESAVSVDNSSLRASTVRSDSLTGADALTGASALCSAAGVAADGRGAATELAAPVRFFSQVGSLRL